MHIPPPSVAFCHHQGHFSCVLHACNHEITPLPLRTTLVDPEAAVIVTPAGAQGESLRRLVSQTLDTLNLRRPGIQPSRRSGSTTNCLQAQQHNPPEVADIRGADMAFFGAP
jgi:hypothetical protein